MSPFTSSSRLLLAKTSLLCLVCIFSTVHTQGKDNEGTSFLNLDSIKSKSVLLYKHVQYSDQYRLYPQLTFTCNGTIDRILFLAKNRNSNETEESVQFSLWNTLDNVTWSREGDYVKLNSSLPVCGDTVCVASVQNTELRFEAGYRFGARLPGKDSPSYELIHQSEGGLSFFLQSSPDGLNNSLNFTATVGKMDKASPLLAIETDQPECVQGFLSREALMQSAEILNREQNLTYTDVIEFNTQQGLCAVTSLLFTGSFTPNTFVPSTNLRITVELNEQESVVLLNQSIQMTSFLNIFRYQIPNERIKDVNSVQLSMMVALSCT